jgi:hypothetical protein
MEHEFSTTFWIIAAAVTILIIFYTGWRFVTHATKANRIFARRQEVSRRRFGTTKLPERDTGRRPSPDRPLQKGR